MMLGGKKLSFIYFFYWYPIKGLFFTLLRDFQRSDTLLKHYDHFTVEKSTGSLVDGFVVIADRQPFDTDSTHFYADLDPNSDPFYFCFQWPY